MTVFTYWGNKNEKVNGTSVLEIASGIVDIGQSGDFTDSEYDFLSQDYILLPGVVPWTRNDFPWSQDVKNSFPNNQSVSTSQPLTKQEIVDTGLGPSDIGATSYGQVIAMSLILGG